MDTSGCDPIYVVSPAGGHASAVRLLSVAHSRPRRIGASPQPLGPTRRVFRYSLCNCERHSVQDVGERQKDRTDAESSTRPLLTATQVKGRLGIDRSTVYRMATDGRLQAVKVGRQWRFSAADIDALLTIGGQVHSATDGTSSRPLSVSVAAATSLLTLTAERLGLMMVITDLDGQPLSEMVNPCPWYASRAQDPDVIETCIAERRLQAYDPILAPEFKLGVLGFECARAFVRDGAALVAMVVAGGVAPAGQETPGLYVLDEHQRAFALANISRVAAALSRVPLRPQTESVSRSWSAGRRTTKPKEDHADALRSL